jgi:geranylgeranyl diphosphate synthase type II
VKIKAYLKDRAALIDAALDRYTTPGADQGAGPDLREVPHRLLEAIRYSLMAGGKRLRPVMVLAAAEVYGLPPERVMLAAGALEMIHTYSLIHDDLPCMDDDDLRRGRPTNHKVYGDALATLAGDALLTMAFELLGRQGLADGVTRLQAARVVVEMATAAGAGGMVGGQVEDLAGEGRQSNTAQLERIHRLKTGALFRAGLRVGAILGGADEPDLVRLDTYAAHFGLAFQIQDDLLDVIGDAVKTGKGVGRDERLQKSTYVTRYGLDEARRRAAAEVAAAQAVLAPLGARAEPLVALAQFVIDREG